MIKDDIVMNVAEATGCGTSVSKKIVNATIKTIQQALKSGEPVIIRGLGTFSFRQAAPRSVRNINIGVQYKIGSRKRMIFTPSKELKF